MVGRVATPAKALGEITATVERSMPPRAPASTVRTIVCQWLAVMAVTTEVGAITAPIALALLSFQATIDGRNVVPVPAAGVVSVVNRRRQLPLYVLQPLLTAVGILPVAAVS